MIKQDVVENTLVSQEFLDNLKSAIVNLLDVASSSYYGYELSDIEAPAVDKLFMMALTDDEKEEMKIDKEHREYVKMMEDARKDTDAEINMLKDKYKCTICNKRRMLSQGSLDEHIKAKHENKDLLEN